MEIYKTSSCKNTFLHINKKDFDLISDKDKFIQKICSPPNGISTDGVVVYQKNKNTVSFNIYNKDGTAAEISGNGMAGLSAILFNENFFSDISILKTGGGEKKVYLIKQTAENTFHQRIEIGCPNFKDTDNFPFLKDQVDQYIFNNITFYPVCVGNPHVVILFLKTPKENDLVNLGKEISTHPLFPKGTNVEFAWDINKNGCKIFFYERGVGPTYSSSTGSAAVYAVLDRLKLINSTITINNINEPIRIFKKNGILIENCTKILYKGILR